MFCKAPFMEKQDNIIGVLSKELGEWGHFDMDLHPSVTGSLSHSFLATFGGKPDLQSLSNGKFFIADLFS